MALTNKKNNRKCIVCNCDYYFCNHCQDGEIKPSWYNIFHNQNCHDIYDAVANILPVKGKEAAKVSLDKCDLSNKENFHPNIIKLINNIYDIVDEDTNNKEENVEVIENNKNNEDVDVASNNAEIEDEVKEEKTVSTTSAMVVKRTQTRNNKNKK